MTYTNVQRVRILYKTILRLHRGLPQELRELGTNYAKDEFKRHKECGREEAEIFIKEWTNYALTLTHQLGVKGPQSGSKLGIPLSEADLEKFKEEQIYQLHELLEAAKSENESDRNN